MAKKKMSKAQAAAARREQTPQTQARARSRELSKQIRAEQRLVQKQASRSIGWRLIVPMVLIIALVVLAMVFTIAPGMFLGA